MCKMARGEMVRYMAENQITKPEDICNFDRLGYAFDPAYSNKNTYVFVKGKNTNLPPVQMVWLWTRFMENTK